MSENLNYTELILLGFLINGTLILECAWFGDTINSVYAYPINRQGVSEPINMSLNLLKGNIPEKKRKPLFISAPQY